MCQNIEAVLLFFSGFDEGCKYSLYVRECVCVYIYCICKLNSAFWDGFVPSSLGTVWMLEILSLIRNNGDPNWCRTVPNWDRGPWFETVLGYRIAQTNKSPRIISSHLPVQLFAKSFSKSKAKIIYTVRNPKDVLVSLYHFASMFRPYKDPGTLDQFLDVFLKGDVPFGSWFDHVKGWMNLKDKENIFFITYEELQEDLRGSVARICQFLGKDLDDAAIDSVVANASFEAMKSNKMSNFSLSPRFLMNQKKSAFLRKGISGDWKNHLTPVQSECFDRIYQERLQDLSVTFPWDKE
nr:PREDICTED: sulfotransferase family cytosolic 2B member 1 isoform X1 [Anolis carolinensis]|eukprot:XP_016851556.1 PREDICTED: sulfotransferase family cytosolic 2B member 1 isoform X1 [Anolis carolinensis]